VLEDSLTNASNLQQNIYHDAFILPDNPDIRNTYCIVYHIEQGYKNKEYGYHMNMHQRYNNIRNGAFGLFNGAELYVFE